MNPVSAKLIIVMIFSIAYKNYAQEIHVQSEAKPLSNLLKELHQTYGIQVSFNARLLEDCLITMDQNFASPSETITALAGACNCHHKYINGVFILIPQNNDLPQKKAVYYYQGNISDRLNHETLPFASVLINNTNIITDEDGNFSYQSQDSVVRLIASHLGYFITDTIIKAAQQLRIGLYPSIEELQEVTVLSRPYLKTINSEQKTGLVKLNNRATPFLPGATDNSLFSFLRLQAGVLASGEQNNDYILWGSYKGQTHILFDGITIFDASSYSDEIGTINPLIIKDIEVLKGGYSVDVGDRVGGVVSISSKSGNTDTAMYHITSTQKSYNTHLNAKLTDQSSLQLGGRFVAAPDFASFPLLKVSDFFFGDIVAKYTFQLKNGDNFRVTSLFNIDRSERLKDVINSRIFLSEILTTNLFGTSLRYNKRWKRIGQTTAKFAYSKFQSNHGISSIGIDTTYSASFRGIIINSISEMSLKLSHHLPATSLHNTSIGLNLIYNKSGIRHDAIEEFNGVDQEGIRLGAYIKDEITISKRLLLRSGIRIDVPIQQYTNVFVQPRIELIVTPMTQWKINLSYGLYNQFVTENALVDTFKNYTYHWSVIDNRTIPIIEATHAVAGVSCQYKYWSGRLEGYYRNTNNILQYWGDPRSQRLNRSIGVNYSYGVDLKLTGRFKNQKIWFAYTLSRSEEKLDKRPVSRAPHDQRHEFKIAGMFNLKAFYLSVNYVYGTGFPNIQKLNSEENIQPYSRMDIATLYQFNFKSWKMDFGCSILNVLNTYNIRYSNFMAFAKPDDPYTQASPLAVTLFMNFRF